MQWFRMLQMVTLAAAGALAGAGAEIIAHRGASHDAPENTVAAAKLAWQRTVDFFNKTLRS